MADFHLWSKDSLVKLAEEQTERIHQLEDDLRAVQEAWRVAVTATQVKNDEQQTEQRLP